jgi:hypothetical protein
MPAGDTVLLFAALDEARAMARYWEATARRSETLRAVERGELEIVAAQKRQQEAEREHAANHEAWEKALADIEKMGLAQP